MAFFRTLTSAVMLVILQEKVFLYNVHCNND